jgi:hypothetical protein
MKIPVVGYSDVRNLGIVIGSPEWFEWLDATPSFRYEFEFRSFTARYYGKGYWNAYRKRFGKLRQQYLGKTEDLTIERLDEVGKILALPDVDYWKLRYARKREKQQVAENSSITLSSETKSYSDEYITSALEVLRVWEERVAESKARGKGKASERYKYVEQVVTELHERLQPHPI